MKNRDAKMRERYLQREDDRLLKKVYKQELKAKKEFYARTDKDEREDDAFQHLLELKAKLEEMKR